ncbi:MAG: polysaccharide export protein [Deltaproteobacteria bacterium]|nr:polysaccharide export protein [Deltaproteobacteria bacterium]
MRRFRAILQVLLLPLLLPGLGLVTGSGCTAPDREGYVRMTATLVQSRRSMTLGPGDVFEVRVYGEEDLSGTFRVGEAGEISFPLAGRIPVDGLSPTQVETILEQRLADGYLRSPYVTVFVREYNSKTVSVLGQVKNPGTFPFSPDMNIIQAITLAGGLLETARGNAVVVTRQEGGQELQFKVPVLSVSEGEVPNFPLEPGDIIFVPKTLL